MISPHSRWLWCWLAPLVGTALFAQQSASPAPSHAIPDGTTFLIRLVDKLDASRVRPGKRFKARLAEDLVGPDETRILHDSVIRGHVSSVSNGIHPRLLLSFDEIECQHGWAPLMATITAVPGEHGLRVSGEEGEIEIQGSRRELDPAGGGPTGGRSPNIEAAIGVVGAVFSDRRLQMQRGTTLEVRLDHALQPPRR
jgi:hypothetical protein